MDGWSIEFEANESGTAVGLNDPGIETYLSEPCGSVARECGQNSLDAAEGETVEVKFDSIEVPIQEIPCLDYFKDTIQSCLDKSKQKGIEKAVDFFENAKSLLNELKLWTLCISDFNTTGLKGPCEEGSPFHSLVKAIGESVKINEASGGSFGIGKFAVYANSDLRTVIYSTKYKNEEHEECILAQGRSILISHTGRDGRELRPDGYWGKNKYAPIDEIEKLPVWMKRNEIGTSVFALGFRFENDWKHSIASTLIINFLVAIHNNKIRFGIEHDKIVIDSQGLYKLLHDAKIEEVVEENNQKEDLQQAKCLYECITSEESIDTIIDIKGLGKVAVKVLVKEGLPQKVWIFRNGMKITDSLKDFGDSFARFPMYKDFIALVEPVDSEASSLFKRLESPRHDNLSPRIMDQEKNKEAKRVMSKLAKNIRNLIKSEAWTEPEDSEDLDELAEFFDDSKDHDSLSDPTLDDDPERPNVHTIKPKKSTNKQDIEAESEPGEAEGGGSGESDGSGGDAGGMGPSSGSGEGGTGVKPVGVCRLSNIRNVTNQNNKSMVRTLWFTPSETADLELSLQAIGIDRNIQLSIAESSLGDVVNGNVRLSVDSGQRVKLKVRIDDDQGGPINLFGSVVARGDSDAD